MDYTFEDSCDFRRNLERKVFGEPGLGYEFYDKGAARNRQQKAVDRIIAEHRQEELNAADFRAWEKQNETFFAEQDRNALAVANRRPTVFDRKYRLTGNAFNGNFHTWRMFPSQRGIKLEDLRKTDENRAVKVAFKEAAENGSVKIAFHKTIRFKREKGGRGPNGEIIYDRMKHFFKGPQHIITRKTTKKEIRDLYRRDMDNIQEEIEQWS